MHFVFEIREILILFVYQCWFDVVCVGPRGALWVQCMSGRCRWIWSIWTHFCLLPIRMGCFLVLFESQTRQKALFWFYNAQFVFYCSFTEFFCLLRLNLFASFCSCGLSVIELMVLHKEDDSVAFWDWSIEAEAPKFVLKGKKTFLLWQYSFYFPELWMFHFLMITRFKVGLSAWCCFCFDFCSITKSFYWM